MIVALVVGAGVVGAGGILCALGVTRVGFLVQAAGAVAIAVGGFWILATGTSVGDSFAGVLAPRLGVDPLSGFFLGTLGATAAPALLFASRYTRGRATGALVAAFTLTLAWVLCARDPVMFLAAWELMTLIPAAIILVNRSDRAAQRAVFVYVSITHLGGAGTWVAVLLASAAGALDGPGAVAQGSGLQAAIALAALVGMGTKAGVIPLHAWLPRAHPIAPAPVSALMSGVMIKVAIYGLVRVLFEWLGGVPLWIGGLVLCVGALSAVGGVVYALFQHDLKRLLALHSIENIGIIVLGLGASLLLGARDQREWAAIALGAALLHTLNHALFKSLLFLGAGAFERAAGALELDRLGGLLRRMPWTGGAFLVGSMAIAGLPPLNGFASEWLTLQALVHVPLYGGVADGVVGAIGLALLAATAALAVFCFVKVVGLVLLGAPRRERVAQAVEAPPEMRTAVAALAGACLVLGVAPGFLFGKLAGIDGQGPGIDLPTTGTLPTGWIAVALVGFAGVLVVLRGRREAATAPTWACGQAVEPSLAWTSAGFTKPLRLVLEAVLRPEREIDVRTEGGVVQEVSYRGSVPHLFDIHLYRPVHRVALALAARTRRLQSGRLGVYVAYLIALVAVLLFAARVGVIG